MTHKRFNFKSSGIKTTNRKIADPVVVKNPIGIKTPLAFGNNSRDDLYKMHFHPGDQMKDNFKNLILTNFGERLGNCNFGANLKDLSYDLAAIDKFEAEASRRIIDATKRYIPAIAIRQIDVIDIMNNLKITKMMPDDSIGLALIRLRIKYDIPRIKIFNQHLEVSIYVGG